MYSICDLRALFCQVKLNFENISRMLLCSENSHIICS